MKITSLILLTFFFIKTQDVYTQTKEIKIISSNNYSNSDIDLLKELRYRLLGKNEKNKSEFSFKISNSLDNYSINIKNQNDFNLITKNSPNKNFENLNLLKNNLENLVNENTFEYVNSFQFQIDNTRDFTDLTSLYKAIKKSSLSSIIIIWNNGFNPYIFSPENINYQINIASKEDLTPVIIKPKFKEQLRPDESHYYIEFDSVGIFPSYEIAIYWRKPIGQTYNNEIIYDSILFIKECLSFTRYSDFLSSKSRTKIGLFSVEGSKCKIAIEEIFLATICYQNWKSVIRTEELPDYDSCEPCKSECLYDKNFIVSIKGCATGIDNELNDCVNYFQFQCPKGLKQ